MSQEQVDGPRAAALQTILGVVRTAAPAYPVAVVAGPRGSGRSTLLRQGAEQLGLEPVWIDCAAFAAQDPLRSLREALFSSSPSLFPTPMATRLEAELARTADDPEAVERLVWSIVRGGLDQLRGKQVVGDDFDLLDPQSQQVAAYVVRRVAQLGAPVLLSVETAGPALERCPTVDLTPLGTTQARELIEDLRGLPIPCRVAERLVNRTGGNLLALTEIGRELSEEQLGGRRLLSHPLPVPRSVARRLGPDHRGALALLAGLAFDETLPLELAVALAGSAEELQQASAAGLVHYQGNRVRAVEAAQALAAWWVSPADVRERVHHVLSESTQPCATVHRACLGRPVSDEALVRAATELYDLGRQGHAGLALDLLDRQLSADGYPLARRLLDDGYLRDVRDLTDLSGGIGHGLLPDDLESLRTQVAVLTGLVREPVSLDYLDRPATQVSATRIQTALGAVRSLLQREDFGAAEGLLAAAGPAIATAPPDVQALARFVSAEVGFHQQEESSIEEFSRAAEDWLAHYRGHEAISTSIMVFYLLVVGNTQLAGRVLNRTQPVDGAGALTRVAHVVGRLQTELARGQITAADDLIAEMDRTMPYSGGGPHSLSAVVAVTNARGPSRWRDRVEWRLDHPDIAGQPSHSRSEVAAAFGQRCLVEGDYERAVVLLCQALEARESLCTGATAVLASLLEANLAAGASAGANRSLMLELGEWWPDVRSPRFPGLRARCAALCVEADELAAAFEVAVARCPDSHPLDLGRTVLAYGRRLLLVGDADAAARQLDRAGALFANERLGGWVGHVERLRSGPSAAADEQLLSPTEREIVTLVLQRRTNAEIARTLFMSKRTVELHLTRVFRKFRVSRKSQLIELDSVREAVRVPAARV